jgi:hypothetical protein
VKTIKTIYGINYPQVDLGTESFTFTTNNALGTFVFVFKWLNGKWNGWATLPSGEVKPFGCIPEVIDWTEFTDYGILFDSGIPSLGLSGLVGSSRLYLIEWGVE